MMWLGALLVVTVGLLPSLGARPVSAAVPCPSTPITPGNTINGTLNALDCLLGPQGGAYFAEYY